MPLKVMCNAFYDIKGLTYQGHLNQFWPSGFKPDMKLFTSFRLYLLTNTQINAVYYGGYQAGDGRVADAEYPPLFISQKRMMIYTRRCPL